MSELLALLDAVDDLPEAIDLRERSYRHLGDTVVDVGCGGGRAVGELAARGVKAVGVDLDPGMVGAASARWPDVEFRVGDAADLPFDDGSCTGYRADKVLHNLVEPGLAVAEARRVLVRRGRAVLVGQDWDGVITNAEEPVTAQGIARPRVARQYRNLLLDNGFVDVTVEASMIVFTDPAFLPVVLRMGDERFAAEQQRLAAVDRMFVAIPFFLAVGTRGD